jgi:hypothetical protein
MDKVAGVMWQGMLVCSDAARVAGFVGLIT